VRGGNTFLLTCFEKTNLENLKKEGMEIENINNNKIHQFGFDDSTYTRYGKIYESICKAIAVRAYYYFLTTKTENGKLPIKELCENFGKVTNEEITYYIAEKQGIDLDADRQETL